MDLTFTAKTLSNSSSVTSSVGYQISLTSALHIQTFHTPAINFEHGRGMAPCLISITRPGIIDNYIDPPKLLHRLFQTPLPIIDFRNIHLHEMHGFRILRGDLLASFRVEIGNYDFCSFKGEADRNAVVNVSILYLLF